MVTEVILHVGPAKTGTTSIQNALSLGRDELRAAGIHYPETAPPSVEGQHPLAWDILEAVGTEPWRWGSMRLSWEQVLEGAARAGAHTILVSSEYFSSFRDSAAFRRLRAALADAPTTLVFGLRDPTVLVPSHWQQAVKWGVGDGEELLPLDEAVPVLLQRSSIQVRPFVEMAVAQLAPVRVRLFTVPRRPDNRELLTRFGRAAGFPPPLTARLSDIDAEIKNESLAAEDCRLLLALNRILFAPEASGSAHLERGSPARLEARRLILEQLRTEDAAEPAPVKATGDAWRALTQLRADILSWLAGGDFEVHGPLDDLSSAADGDPGPDAAARPSARPRRGPSPRLVQLLFNTLLSQATALRDSQAAKEWHRQQGEDWERECRRLAERVESLVCESRELATARDWHRQQSENWERECRRLAERVESLVRESRELTTARDWHRQQSENWERVAQALDARLAERPREAEAEAARAPREADGEAVRARRLDGQPWQTLRDGWRRVRARMRALPRIDPPGRNG